MILPPPLKAPRLLPGDARTIVAWTALVAALSGAIELRVKVGSISDRVDAIEKRLDRMPEVKQYARAD